MFELMPDPKEYPHVFTQRLARYLIDHHGKEKARTFARALLRQIEGS
jgi:hypothetical protein